MVRADCLVLRHGAEAQRKSSGGQGGSVRFVKVVERRMVEAGDWINRGEGSLALAIQAEGIFFKTCLLIPQSLGRVMCCPVWILRQSLQPVAHGRHRHTIFHVSTRFLLYFLCAFNFLFLPHELRSQGNEPAHRVAVFLIFRFTFSLRVALCSIFLRRVFFRRRRSIQQPATACDAGNDFYTSRLFYRFR